MVLDFGKESVSIMFTIFSIAITILASSAEFTSDTYYDDNLERKTTTVTTFDLDKVLNQNISEFEKIQKIEEFLLHNAALSLDDRKLLFYDTNMDYNRSFEIYENPKLNDFSEYSQNRLKLAMIPVYYNIGNEKKAQELFDEVRQYLESNLKLEPYTIFPFLLSMDNIINAQEISIIKSKTISQYVQDSYNKLDSNDEFVHRYWYSQYVLDTDLKEFPGCDNKIFGKIKCTHKELSLIDNMINDLNYDSYFFDMGNKYQKDKREFYQDDIKAFFDIYMNWIIIGVFIAVMISWTTIVQRKFLFNKIVKAKKLIKSFPPNNDPLPEAKDPPWKIISFSVLGWAVTGYAFFTLIVFGDSFSGFFFDSDNPSDSHYVLFSVIALSLLARFVGGMLFGRLGDLYGRLFVIKFVLIGVTLTVAVSSFIPFTDENPEFISIFFIASRVLIGFFTGGLWPTGGVYALEKLQYYYSKNKVNNNKKINKNQNERFIKKLIQEIKGIFPITKNPTQIKTLGWQSSWVQSGFQWSIMLEVLLSFSFTIFGISLFEFGTDWHVSQWIIISIIGVVMGLFSIGMAFTMKPSEQWKRMRKRHIGKKYKAIFDLRQDIKNKKTRKTIVNLWLIMAGVMYLFYSTMGVMGAYYGRSDFLVTECTDVCVQPLFHPIWLTMISLIAHIVPGHFLSRSKWYSKIRNGQSNPDKSTYYRLLKILDVKLLLKRKIRYVNEDELGDKSSSNPDSRIILVHAYLVLYLSIIFAIIFFVIFLINGNTQLVNPYADWDFWANGTIYVVVWLFTIAILFIVTSTWSIIPAILSSSFSIERRNFWVSTIYTGGVIVGFAAPFVSLQIIQQYDHVWLLVPLILGTISIIIGARSFIIDNIKRPGDVVVT